MNRMLKRKTEPPVDRSRISRAGGTGFQPVISGVAPEIVRLSSRLELGYGADEPRAREIRRDAGFYRRDACSTLSIPSPD
jgi:hypothetical protein